MLKKKDPLNSATPYDDAFRTMEQECNDILIPFVNYMFNENYAITDRVIRSPNEQFIERDDGIRDKRITDSNFEIIHNGIGKRYHLECESSTYDTTILIRIFEYDSQIALSPDNMAIKTDHLNVRFPRSGLLVLRSSDKTPSEAVITIETPDGSISYKVPIINIHDLTIDDMFNNRLYLLIPFYIFKCEDRLAEIDKSDEEIDILISEFSEIIEKLRAEQTSDHLSESSQSVIINLSVSVINKLTKNYKSVQQKVGDYMGGHVIELPVIVAKREGRKEGQLEGRAEDHSESIRKLTDHYLQEHPDWTEEQAKEAAVSILG